MDKATEQWGHYAGIDEAKKPKKTFKIKGFGQQPSEKELKTSEFFKKGIK